MPIGDKNDLLSVGIYGVPEASRLTKVSRGRIRRWIKGYDFRSGEARRHSDAVWAGSIAPLDGKVALGFLDLIEIRFVDAFLSAGVSWKTMRKAHQLARAVIENDHPFCTNRFAADGRRILLKPAAAGGDAALMDLLSKQEEFQKIVDPFLTQLEFANDDLARWWPMGQKRTVVLDPVRNLGQPTVSRSGVPTEVLARSAKANESVEAVAAWYEVLREEVLDAVEFEQSLAA